VCLSVEVCEGGGVRPPPRERVSRAVAEGRVAECVCEAESELESVGRRLFLLAAHSALALPHTTQTGFVL